MTEVTDRYFHSHTYEAVIDQLENIARTFDPAAPDDLRTRIIEAVGELGAWPAYAFTGVDGG
ncbi:hypothetical protein [Brucella anthropi]|uniref:hypothetical protein n=1 Tax=Brucella anthropi TaxID=529 RepID=UPI0005BB949D|nr:hypothetical protein [Brucella anthropi]KIU68522.1 hypothetical protein TR92_11785 [Brucella anthropi]